MAHHPHRPAPIEFEPDAFFPLDLDNPPATFEVYGRALVTTHDLFREVAVQDIQVMRGADGRYHLTVRLHNTGTQEATIPHLFITYYDEQNRVVWVDDFYLDEAVRPQRTQDRFGNIMLDGTQISFVVTGPTGEVRLIPAQTVDGIAETVLQAPELPGEYEVQAAVFGMASEPLRLTFTPGPAISRFPIHLAIDNENDELHLTAGPITAALAQYVPDGTLVQFALSGPEGEMETVTAVAEAGYATATLRLSQLPSGPYQAQATAGAGQGTARFTMP
ncbi:MAG: hypothetical protein H6658_16375 [Ardenticatenaceae bacterium]|nr:hypothetical protein [Ardenticatenaceae bacterium]